jgi:hypothetical protein
MGHLQTFGEFERMSALPLKVDIRVTQHHVRLGPKADLYLDRDCGERYDDPILHWKVSPDISYKPVRHRAPQENSELTQTLRRDGG